MIYNCSTRYFKNKCKLSRIYLPIVNCSSLGFLSSHLGRYWPVCVLHLYIPKNSFEGKFGNCKKLQIASIIHSIVLWFEPGGCLKLVQKILDEHSQPKDKQRIRSNNQEALIQRVCRKKIQNGLFTATIKVLTSNGVATNEEDTLNNLIDGHPYALSPYIPTNPIVVDSTISSNAIILSKIKSILKGTSCGRDGLRVQHHLDLLNGPASVVAEELLTVINGVVNFWLKGSCLIHL